MALPGVQVHTLAPLPGQYAVAHYARGPQNWSTGLTLLSHQVKAASCGAQGDRQGALRPEVPRRRQGPGEGSWGLLVSVQRPDPPLWALPWSPAARPCQPQPRGGAGQRHPAFLGNWASLMFLCACVFPCVAFWVWAAVCSQSSRIPMRTDESLKVLHSRAGLGMRARDS